MTDSPKTLTDNDGRWMRRDALIDEMIEDNSLEGEAAEALVANTLTEMIEEGPMRCKEVGDVEYVQLESFTSGVTALAKYKSEMAKDSATDFVRSLTGDDQ